MLTRYLLSSLVIVCLSQVGSSAKTAKCRSMHTTPHDRPGTLEVKKVGFLYSAAYAMAGPARFTISKVVVDWQEPMVLQRKLRPSIARVNVHLDPLYAASKHTSTPINHAHQAFTP